MEPFTQNSLQTHLKCYPTYDLQGLLFGLDRTRVCRWVKILLPVLEMTLGREWALLNNLRY
ncbi:transposase family protein [Symbiopectobacterium purcellii]|uniref:transposase family protein n=1 Tax=Symbiopectobacterium purcellii TaxID=2871826 RepID=UPI003F8732E2